MINKRQMRNRRIIRNVLRKITIFSVILEFILGITLCGIVEGSIELYIPVKLIITFIANFGLFMLIATVNEKYNLGI